MMKLLELLKKTRKYLIGSFKDAVLNGMIAEEGVTVMRGCNFGSEPYLIHLHKNCRISLRVTFVNHDGVTWAFRNDHDEYKHVFKFGKIEIGEYSFIGANSTILPGVTIGDHCVIGAGSVVTKDIPSGMVAAGVPARVLCTLEEYAEKCKLSMPENYEDIHSMGKRDYLVKSYMRNSK